MGNMWQSWDLNPRLPDFKICFLFNRPHRPLQNIPIYASSPVFKVLADVSDMIVTNMEMT